jgi:hypothetical protein
MTNFYLDNAKSEFVSLYKRASYLKNAITCTAGTWEQKEYKSVLVNTNENICRCIRLLKFICAELSIDYKSVIPELIKK